MSGQWEVVGRNKKEKLTAPNKKAPKVEKKINIPKVEDVLPSSQVKNLYALDGKSNKENKKPQEKEKPKETVKKQVQKKNEKNQEPKTKTYKSIESALNSINTGDFKTALETTMEKFPDAPLVWLKEVSSFLNGKLTVELSDPVFTNRPDGYPLSAVPSGIRQVMEKALEKAGKTAAQLSFDQTVTAMAVDLSKGHPAMGHKLWIQFLAVNNPHLTTASLDKHVGLRTSYQNRQAIGLSILWALGQGGITDFNTGFKVFKEFMMPLLEMKNYSRYVVQYLGQLLKRHENQTLSKENYMFLFDFCHSKHNLPNDVTQQLVGLTKSITTMVLSKGSDKKCTHYFEFLLVKLTSATTNVIKNDIASTLVSFLSKDPNCFNTWLQMYIKNLSQSNTLLKYINEHWKKTSPQLDLKRFKDTLQTFTTTNTQLSTSPKKDPALKDATTICKVLLDKMTVSKSFPWKTVIFIIFLSTASFFIYDVRKHGDWQKSQSVRTLKDMGVWEYGEKTWDRANQGLNWTRQRIEEYAPGYIDTAVEKIEPYVELTRDLGLVLYNLGDAYRLKFIEKYPQVAEFFEKSIPAVVETVQKNAKFVAKRSTEFFSQGYDYLTTQVFVGDFSPENMHKSLMKVFDTTQKYAIEYYHWLYEKIDTTINGK